MDAMQTYLDETEFEDIIGPIEVIDARVEDEELLHKNFESHLLSSRADHYRAGMHPDAVRAETIHNTSVIPDYPISSMKGFAYVIRTDEWAEEDVETPWKSMQFRVDQQGSPKRVKSAFLSEYPCDMWKFDCSGSKHCQHIDPKLMSSYFDVGTLSYFEDREAIQGQYAQPSGLNKAAVIYSWNIVKLYKKGNACSGGSQDPTCRPVLQRSRHRNPAGVYQMQVQCCGKTENEDDTHHFTMVPSKYDGNISAQEIMEANFNNYELQHTNSGSRCFQVNEKAKKKKTCGNMIHAACGVKFWFLIPVPSVRSVCPYIIILSKGMHTHPPPPQTQIQASLLGALKRSIEASSKERHYSTGGKISWLLTHSFQEFLRKFDADSLSDIHPALSNDDRIRYYIRKHKAIHQDGHRGRAAVEQEWTVHQLKSDDAVFDNGENFLAICFSQGMAKLWANCKTVQIDMNYKRVLSKKEHEIIFAARMDDSFGFMPMARAFMSGESADDYCRLFKTLFSCLQRHHVGIKWKYAEGEGFSGVTLDQDAGCIKGLYLAERYSHLSNDWVYHTQRTVRLCDVHYRRGITAVLRKSSRVGNHAKAKRMMMALLTAPSLGEYYKLCTAIELVSKDEFLIQWARHKQHPYIASGLSFGCSFMSRDDWDIISPDTNGVESQHQKSYTVAGGEYLDDEMLSRYYNFRKTGSRDRWNNNTAAGRAARGTARQQQEYRARVEREGGFRDRPDRQTQESVQPLLPDESLPEDLSTQLPGPSARTVSVSSSGVPRIRLEAEAISAVLDSTVAAQLPTVHEQGWTIVFQQKQLDRVAALSAALPIVNDDMAFQKILQELGEVSTAKLNYVSPDDINLTIPEYAPSLAIQDSQVLFQRRQLLEVAILSSALMVTKSQTVSRMLMEQLQDLTTKKWTWNPVSPAGTLQSEISDQGGMTASPLNKRHRELVEEDELMQQIAPGRRADNRLIVPAALTSA
ncbi:hypothetical protein E4U26_008084, partial [Claviceps purpurea]